MDSTMSDKYVTDPALLQQLNAPSKQYINDPALLAELNGELNYPKLNAQQIQDNALRQRLQGQSFLSRNLEGAMTAPSNLIEGIKQGAYELINAKNPLDVSTRGVPQQGYDTSKIRQNRVIASEAPVGAFGGNVLTALPLAFLPGGQRMAGQAVYGSLLGAMQPTMGDESRTENMVTGGLAGAAFPLASKATTAGGKLGAALLGETTGTSTETVKEAAKSGFEGNKKFLTNLRTNEPMANVVNEAKDALNNMRMAKNAEYRQGMAGVTQDKSILDFSDIYKGVSDALNKVTFKGQVKDKFAADKVGDAKLEIDRWKNLNANDYHTPEGMDALKQKIGGILETIPYEQKTARSAIQDMYNSVKGTIEKQAPDYNNVMKDYSEASSLINEIEKSLSLGKKNFDDQALRKLQSLTRNNAQTNFGNRLSLAEELKNKGGADLMPSLAGQAMSSLMPRGLTGKLSEGALALASLQNPAALLGSPFFSPRLMGEMLYAGGRGVKGIQNVLQKLPVSAEQAKKLGFALSTGLQNTNQGEQ